MTTTEPAALRRLRFAWTAAVVAGAISPAVGQVQIEAMRLGPSIPLEGRAYASGNGIAAGAGGTIGQPLPVVFGATTIEFLPMPSDHHGAVRGVGDGYIAGHTSVPVGSATAGVIAAFATIWSGPNRTRTVLNPPDESQAIITSVRGNQQVGNLGTSASIPVLVHFRQAPPAEFVSVQAQPKPVATAANHVPQAVLWNGTAESMVRLTPAGADGSIASDTDGQHQVGAVFYEQYNPRAVRWSGTPDSFLDLHPADAAQSIALANDGTMTVGSAYYFSPGAERPLLWIEGTAQAATLLPTTGFRGGRALDVIDGVIVGELDVDYTLTHAALWLDGGATLVDLHNVLNSSGLPDTYFRSSARSISIHNGNFVVVGFGQSFTTGTHPLTWTFRVPEPATTSLLGLVALGFLRTRHHRP